MPLACSYRRRVDGTKDADYPRINAGARAQCLAAAVSCSVNSDLREAWLKVQLDAIAQVVGFLPHSNYTIGVICPQLRLDGETFVSWRPKHFHLDRLNGKGALGVVFTHIMGGKMVSRLQMCNYLTTYPKHGVLSLWWAGMCGLSIMMRVDNTHAEMAALVYS